MEVVRQEKTEILGIVTREDGILRDEIHKLRDEMHKFRDEMHKLLNRNLLYTVTVIGILTTVIQVLVEFLR